MTRLVINLPNTAVFDLRMVKKPRQMLTVNAIYHKSSARLKTPKNLISCHRSSFSVPAGVPHDRQTGTPSLFVIAAPHTVHVGAFGSIG